MKTLYFARLAIVLIAATTCSMSSRAQLRKTYLDTVNTSNNITKISFFSPSAGYIASTGSPNWVGYTSDSGHTVVRKYITLGNVDYNGYSVNLTFGFGISGVKAFSQDTLLAYGDYGAVPAILYSTNGGNTFKLIYHSQYNSFQLSTGIMDMIFPQNGLIGYAVDADRILKTTNRGLTWSVVRIDPGSYFEYLEAVDNNNILAFSKTYGASKLLKTTNGGTSWTQLALPNASTSYLTYAFFISASKGWISLNNQQYGQIFYTSNGGATWTQKNNDAVLPVYCSKIKFINDSTGFGLTEMYEVLKTTDSGKVWERVPRDNSFTYLSHMHQDIQCFSSTQMWVGGDRDFLEITTNAGGLTYPKALFVIDTLNVYSTNTVNLVNYSKHGYQYKWFVNNALVATTYNASYLHNSSSAVDSVKLVVTNAVRSDTQVRYQYFTLVPPVPLPTIASFSPDTACTDFIVTITGTNLNGATAVSLGGVAASSFSVVSSTTINAVVGSGASGLVKVTTAYGTATKPGFVYTTRLKVTGFTPLSGPVGTTVYINGTNFSPIAANDTVMMGGTRATIVAASSTQLAVTVPIGAAYMPISVRVGRTIAYSNRPFVVTFVGGCPYDSTSFSPEVDYPIVGYEADVLTADLDGDGKLDFFFQDYLSAVRNTSTPGSISFGANTYVMGSAGEVCIADIDGDGRPDICGNGFVFKNTSAPGLISFSPLISYYNLNGVDFIKASDFDGDGRTDLIGLAGNTYTVVKNVSVNGSIAFSSALPSYLTLSTVEVSDCAVADVNGDGKPDLLISGQTYQSPFVAVLINTSTNGLISFNPAVFFPVPAKPNRVIIADIDGDNKPDILTIMLATQELAILKNTSSGNNVNFDTAFVLPGYPDVNGINFKVADMNGDGKLDVIFGYRSNQAFSIHLNTSTPGNISFSSPTPFASEVYPYSLGMTTGDFDGDGKTDIASLLIHVNSPNLVPSLAVYKNVYCQSVSVGVCQNSNTTITSNVVGLSYQWQLDTGLGFTNISNGVNYSGVTSQILHISNVPLAWNNYHYRCIVGSIYSAIYNIHVSQAPVIPVVTTNGSTTICQGNGVGLFSSAATGNQWYFNGSPILNATDTVIGAIQAGSYYVQVTSGACVVNSNTIQVTVVTLPPSPVISGPGSITLCTGSTVTLTSSVSSGNQWFRNAAAITGATSATYTVNQGGQYWVRTFANGCYSDNSNVVTVSQISTPTTPTINVSPASTVCAGTSVTLSASSSGCSSCTFSWNGSTPTANPSITVTAAGTYQVTVTNGCGTAVATQVITTTPNPVITVSASSSSICSGSSTILTASGATTYSWSPATGLSSTSGAVVNASPTVPTVYTVTGVTNGCSGSATKNITVTPTVAPAILITATCSGNTVSFASTSTNGGSSPVIQWFVNNVLTGTGPAFVLNNASNGTSVYARLASSATCASPQQVNSAPVVINCVATAVSNIDGLESIEVLPNPTSGPVTVKFKLHVIKKVVIEVMDASGQRILSTLPENLYGETKKDVDLSKFSRGVYYLKITIGSGVYSHKIVLQ